MWFNTDVIKHWLKMNFHDHSWSNHWKIHHFTGHFTGHTDWLKSLNPPWQRGRSPGSLHTAPAMLGGRGVTEAKIWGKDGYFLASAQKSQQLLGKKWIIMNYLYLDATKLCIEYNLKMELRIVKCHNILELMFKKHISTETDKKTALSESHSHVFFGENVNIIGKTGGSRVAQQIFSVHLRDVVVQLVQGIQQRSQVCLEDHQTSEKKKKKHLFLDLFGPWGNKHAEKGKGKMIETLGGWPTIVVNDDGEWWWFNDDG